MASGELILRKISEVSTDDYEDFSCGKPSLNNFLKEQALLFHNAGLAFTSIVFVEGEPGVVAYFTLTSDKLKLSEMERLDLGLNFSVEIESFPAVKIARLAVAEQFQSKGVGAKLIELIEGLAYNSEIASRLITVDADNDQRTISFYKNLGFEDSLENAKTRENVNRQKKSDSPPPTISMYKDIHKE